MVPSGLVCFLSIGLTSAGFVTGFAFSAGFYLISLVSFTFVSSTGVLGLEEAFMLDAGFAMGFTAVGTLETSC